MYQKKMEKQCENCEAYINFISIGSYHRIVIATIRLSLIYYIKKNKKKFYDWSILKYSKIRQEEYRKIVKCIYNDIIHKHIYHRCNTYINALEEI